MFLAKLYVSVGRRSTSKCWKAVYKESSDRKPEMEFTRGKSFIRITQAVGTEKEENVGWGGDGPVLNKTLIHVYTLKL